MTRDRLIIAGLTSALGYFAIKDDRGAMGGFPEDDPEDENEPEPEKPHGEQNTYGLPDGRRLRRTLQQWFHVQAKTVLGTLPHIGAPLPHSVRTVTDFDGPMAHAMTPMVGAFWDEGGKKARARLGLNPDEWKVTNPHLRRKIEEATLKFCAKTNATTTKNINDALTDLRNQFLIGQVEGGETVKQLRKRVRSIFTGLSNSHAEMIAATEASRGYHAAQVTADEESGVVQGFEWLLSSDACPLCRRLYSKCRQVKIGQSFAKIGHDPDYSDIKFPPCHPRCACTLQSILKPEYGGPENPDFGTTLDQPQHGLNEEEARA